MLIAFSSGDQCDARVLASGTTTVSLFSDHLSPLCLNSHLLCAPSSFLLRSRCFSSCCRVTQQIPNSLKGFSFFPRLLQFLSVCHPDRRIKSLLLCYSCPFSSLASYFPPAPCQPLSFPVWYFIAPVCVSGVKIGWHAVSCGLKWMSITFFY